jgi:hypothetical protein
MPKTTKAAPPQQSSLHEMWGKKQRVGASKVEPDAMDVEIPEEKQGKRLILGLMMLLLTYLTSGEFETQGATWYVVIYRMPTVCLSIG